MNLRFLGDALDHWKGALFASLREAKALRHLAVDPMASDLERWRQDDFKLFARLLRVTPSQLIRHQQSLKNRAAYFDEISHLGDLFLDPDTGVATGRITEAHISPIEIRQLLDGANKRLLIIYQHVRGMAVKARLNQVMKTVGEVVGSFSACSYESGTVAMLFLSRARVRTSQVAEHFEALLGRRAAGRIRRFESRQ